MSSIWVLIPVHRCVSCEANPCMHHQLDSQMKLTDGSIHY